MQLAYKRTKKKIDARKEAYTQDRIRRGFERGVTQRLINYFSKIGNGAAKALEESGTVGFDVYLAQSRPELEKVLKPHWYEVIKTFASRVDNYLFVKRADNAFFTELLDKFVFRVGANHISDIDVTTRKQLQRVLLAGQKDGLPLTEISKNIRERFSPKFSRSRSATIARTETHSAASFANHQQGIEYQKLQPNLNKQWVAVNDDRTREAHRIANGQIVPMDEAFIVDGRNMQYTGDPNGGAANVINCRCAVIYVDDETQVFDNSKPPIAPLPLPNPAPVVSIPDVGGNLNIIPIRNLADRIGNLSKIEITKRIKKRFAENAKDERYIALGNLRTGEVSLGSLDVASSNAILQILDETDKIADRFNVPKLREFKGKNMGSWGSMGVGKGNAGSMSIGSGWMNTYGKYIKSPKSLEATRAGVIKKIEDLQIEIGKTREELTKLTNEVEKIRQKYKGWSPNTLGLLNNKMLAERLGIKADDITFDFKDQLSKDNMRYSLLLYGKDRVKASNKFKKLRKEFEKENHKLRGTAYLDVTKWKRGDAYKDMPHNTSDYFDNALDRVRNTVYHEMGHHVHSMKSHFGRTDGVVFGSERYALNDVLEAYRPYIKKNLDIQASRYSTSDPYEWFAENFALYLQQDTKRMNVEALKLITAVDKGIDLKDAGLIIKESDL